MENLENNDEFEDDIGENRNHNFDLNRSFEFKDTSNVARKKRHLS